MASNQVEVKAGSVDPVELVKSAAIELIGTTFLIYFGGYAYITAYNRVPEMEPFYDSAARQNVPFGPYTHPFLGTKILNGTGTTPTYTDYQKELMDDAGWEKGVRESLGAAFPTSVTVAAVLFVMTAIGGRISGGHFNPVISIAAIACQVGNIAINGVNIVAQILGSFLGAVILRVFLPNRMEHDGLGFPRMGYRIIQGKAFLVEIIITSIYASLYIYGRVAKKRWSTIAAWVALAQLGVGLGSFGFSQGCMNTARVLSPSILSNDGSKYRKGIAHKGFWLFYLGPLLGALIGGTLARYFFYADLAKKNLK